LVKTKELTGKQKAAILLISLGPDVSASIYKYLTEEEIEKLTLEISSIKKVESQKKDEVVNEFYHLAVAQDYIAQGGIGYAKMVLEKPSVPTRRRPSSTASLPPCRSGPSILPGKRIRTRS